MSSDRKLDEVITKLNQLTEDFNKYKNTIDDIIVMNTTLVQEIANQINTKIDIFCNMENTNGTIKSNCKISYNSHTRLSRITPCIYYPRWDFGIRYIN